MKKLFPLEHLKFPRLPSKKNMGQINISGKITSSLFWSMFLDVNPKSLGQGKMGK